MYLCENTSFTFLHLNPWNEHIFIVGALLYTVFINCQVDMKLFSALHILSIVLNLKHFCKWTESQLETMSSGDTDYEPLRSWPSWTTHTMRLQCGHQRCISQPNSSFAPLTKNRQTHNLLWSNHLQFSDKTGLVSQQLLALHSTFSISKQELRKVKTDINYYSLY